MPGGAIGPNVHMMKDAGILDRYASVLAEFPIVVRAGGAWTSVTPGSQQYWLQAFNNVLYGRWKKIDEGFGKAEGIRLLSGNAKIVLPLKKASPAPVVPSAPAAREQGP